MTPERWYKVEELFHQALECPRAERTRFLEAACGGDDLLRGEIESLLASHDATGPSFEETASAVAAEFLAEQNAVTGRMLGRYRVGPLLGSGGMGEVYRAHDVRLDRSVALKVLPSGSGDERARRFAGEARAASAMNHPNICTIYEIGESGGLIFIAMELVEGQTLAKIAKPLPSARILDFARQIASALVEAHSKGVIHRDIKPGNIMATADGRIKVLDFGLAKLSGRLRRGDEAHTATGFVMGTEKYMSPEQRRGEDLDARTDIFSLGVVLYELAVGQVPRLPPGDEAKGIPPGLREVVLRCLETDPDKRCPSAAELLTSLERVRPVRRRNWLYAAGTAAALAGFAWLQLPRPRRPPVRSIAVLPLINLSNAPEQEYFSDGLTEALTSGIARIRALRVVSRSSAMLYKNSKLPLPEIAAKLGVDTVIEGSVLRSGDRVRITLQLIDAASDFHVWSKDYERDLRDVLQLQRDMAREVASEIRMQLAAGGEARASVDPAAHESYLRGRFHWNRRTPDDLRRAVGYLSEAVARQPDYADAHVGLADAYLQLTPYLGVPPSESYPKAEAAARRALEIDPALGEAHATLAVVEHEYNWNHARAEDHFRRAVELDPNYAPAHQWYAEFLTRTRQHESALVQADQALKLDPLSLIAGSVAGWVRHYARKSEDAIRQLRSTLSLDAGFVPARGYLGMSYAAAGDYVQAKRELEQALILSGRASRYISNLAIVHAMAGEKERARQLLEELRGLSQRQPVPAMQIASVLAALRDAEVWTWLERAAHERGVWMLFINFDSLFERLRPDSRFQALLKKTGFTP